MLESCCIIISPSYLVIPELTDKIVMTRDIIIIVVASWYCVVTLFIVFIRTGQHVSVGLRLGPMHALQVEEIRIICLKTK